MSTESGVVLAGALCGRDDECEELYRFEFDTGNVRYAQRSEAIEACTLQYITGIGGILFYHDKTNLYGVDAAELKVVWVLNTPSPDIIRKDGQLLALIGGGELHVIGVPTDKKQYVEELFSTDVEDPVDLAWHKDRLVLIEKNRLREWVRTDSLDSPLLNDPANPIPFIEMGVDDQNATFVWKDENSSFGFKYLQKHDPKEIKPSVIPGAYALDEHGLMTINDSEPRVAYYRFNTSDRTTARLNATATVQTIGGSSEAAMALTTDMHVTRIVARMGQVVINRYEAKYWKLSASDLAWEGGAKPLFLARGNLLVLDAGEANRAQSVSTEDMTWKRLALMEYGSKGILAFMDDKSLTTFHPEGENTIVRWDIRTGAKLGTLSKADWSSAGLTGIRKLERLEDSNYAIAYDADLHFVVINLDSMKLSSKFGTNSALNGVTPALMANAVVVPEDVEFFDNKRMTDKWQIIESDKPARTLELSEWLPSAKITDSLTSYERWYGYCLANGTCLLNETGTERAAGSSEQWEAIPPVDSQHSPRPLPYIVAILALLGIIGTTCWRKGVGKSGNVVINKKKEDEKAIVNTFERQLSSLEMLDKKGRRFVTERDQANFTNRNVFNYLGVRIAISIVLAIIVGIIVAFQYMHDASLLVILAWILILGIPVGGLAWVLLSWDVWNRNYLLRFGRAIEGQWLDTGTNAQAVQYVPAEGVAYKLKRGQWRKVDLVPIILHDPDRPNFALQYTGYGSFPVAEAIKYDKKEWKRATTSERMKQILTLLFFVIIIVLTQVAFRNAFPDPLSVWKLNLLEAQAANINKAANEEAGAGEQDDAFTDELNKTLSNESEEKVRFIDLCLKTCAEDVECQKQCHQHQIKMIFNASGTSYTAEPATSPDAILRTQESALHEFNDILARKDMSCDDLSKQIAVVPVWSDAFEDAFWHIYGEENAFKSANLADVSQRILKEAANIKGLCNDAETCASRQQPCPEPPVCTGSTEKLKNQLCSVSMAIGNVPLNPEQYMSEKNNP